MLQIKNIKKQYKTGTLVQQALNDVSVNFRDNEFVAILGPSGSGKTTLLNVIGGLDKYDSGELIINSVTTKKYSDSDWDYYRNHTIGFVFQSYNLIPHQSVLANVELALTISGISGSEKKQRAMQALKSVGLQEQMHKKPAQMSGGQMQRVAIARALVNDPDIVLADEPTGALDSETSVQVMDLLKEVAKDRLVVMVTHNPDLARQYATRIVTIKDGKILEDTNPYIIKEDTPVKTEKTGKSSMSFLTALSLSFNNLRTKLTRTLLVAIAGSIGIIGIGLIMALSTGVNAYINDTEKEAMSEYPLQITSVGFDMSSMMSNVSGQVQKDKQQAKEEKTDTTITVVDTISSMFKGMNTNDLKSLKAYLQSEESNIDQSARSIEYIYDITPQIFQEESDGVHKVSPSNFYNYTSMSSMMGTSSSSSSSFFALPSDAELYTSQYTLEEGHWPENENEAVLILSSGGSVPDTLLYALGLRDRNEMTGMMNAMRQNKTYQIKEDNTTYTYSDFLNREFKVLSSSDYYSYDENQKIYTSHEDNSTYISSLMNSAIPLKITGIARPSESSNSAMLSTGIGYSSKLTKALMERSKNSDVVKAQLADSSINVFTGTAFSEEKQTSSFNLDNLFSFDSNAFANAFSMNSADFPAMDMDTSKILDMNLLSNTLPSFTSDDLMALTKDVTITQENLSELLQTLYKGFMEDENNSKVLNLYITGLQQYMMDPSSNAQTILKDFIQNKLADQLPQELTPEGLQEIAKAFLQDYNDWLHANKIPNTEYQDHIEEYLNSEQGKNFFKNQSNILLQKILDISISPEDLQQLATDLSEGYKIYAQQNQLTTPDDVTKQLQIYLDTQSPVINKYIETNVTGPIASSFTALLQTKMMSFTDSFSSQLSSSMSYIMGSMTSAISDMMSSAFNIDPQAFANAFQMNMTAEDLQDMMTSFAGASSSSYTSNLSTLGYADEDTPSEIDIYPKDFNTKETINSTLSSYNQKMKDTDQKEKVIIYTDLVATMLSSVTTIVNTLSYVLIAFVGISLVVSSIMIGVITYISVLERRKEIGVLRALGASKHNITQVFNAETVITGGLAGVFGVGLANLLLIPTNMIVHMIADNTKINASLPATNALGLILLSTALTVLAGLIPAKKAAKSDPVIALRSE